MAGKNEKWRNIRFSRACQILLKKSPGFLEKYGTNGSEWRPQKTTKKAQKTRKVNDSKPNKIMVVCSA